MTKELEFLEEKHGDNSWGHYPPSKREVAQWMQEWTEKQLVIQGVSFELPSDDIFDMPQVNLQNPLEEFYYYERPAYLEDDQKQFRERLKKALNYLKGN